MLRQFRPSLPVLMSNCSILHLEAFDCTNYLSVFKTPSKAVLVAFISILGTGVANIHRDILIDGHFRLHEPGLKPLVLR